MKILYSKGVLFFLLSYSFYSYSQVSIKKVSGYSINFKEDLLYNYISIEKSDTIINSTRIKKETQVDSAKIYTAKYYYEFENDSIIINKVEVYNSKDNLVFSRLIYENVLLEKYSFEYDEKSRLLKKSGFGSGDSGSTTYYYW